MIALTSELPAMRRCSVRNGTTTMIVLVLTEARLSFTDSRPITWHDSLPRRIDGSTVLVAEQFLLDRVAEQADGAPARSSLREIAARCQRPVAHFEILSLVP